MLYVFTPVRCLRKIDHIYIFSFSHRPVRWSIYLLLLEMRHCCIIRRESEEKFMWRVRRRRRKRNSASMLPFSCSRSQCFIWQLSTHFPFCPSTYSEWKVKFRKRARVRETAQRKLRWSFLHSSFSWITIEIFFLNCDSLVSISL